MTITHDPALHKLGRKPRKLTITTPRMVSYLSSSVLPKIPSSVLYGQMVSDWGMMLNDTEGDCTAAGIGHTFRLWNAQWVRPIRITDDDVQSLYMAVTKQEGTEFNPANGQNDNGCIESDVLAYVQKNGFAGRSLEAFAYVSHADLALIKATIWMFGCAYVGVDLPVQAQTQNVWVYPQPDSSADATPGSWGGHCIILIGYDDAAKMFTAVTWGQTKLLSYDWWLQYGSEAWGLYSPDWLGKDQLSPTEFNSAQLLEDIKLI